MDREPIDARLAWMYRNSERAIEDKTDWQVFASGEDFLESLDDWTDTPGSKKPSTSNAPSISQKSAGAATKPP